MKKDAVDLQSEVSQELREGVAARKDEIRAAEERLLAELNDIRDDYPRCREATLQCGCRWSLEDDFMEGDSIRHTKDKWHLCDAHEAQGVSL